MKPATTLSELQEDIRKEYGNLSKRLQQVGQYLLDNPENVAFDTVAVIASNADVPPSTLIRFANALGFNGFNDMKQLYRQNMVEETSNYSERIKLFKAMSPDDSQTSTPISQLHNFANANAHALEQLANKIEESDLNNAITLLKNAKCLYVIGLRRSFSIASYMVYALRHLGKRVVLIDGLGGMYDEQLSMVTAKDAVVSISFSPYAEETHNWVKAARDKGAKQVTLTDSQVSPIAELSDVNFVVNEANVGGFRGQSASLCLAQTLAVSLASE
ncbi:putative Transcriptional regulator RpiR family [Vibrio nigripulchritudo SO65]|uniref:MurR/RpiR family transcriptional regulator n=1 Tax=Vibrio nigripulchritudo TaxID=28173 RepID=UPI0003B1E566|nr:MurR/RpiR family transcriptional regulator [Vibrio nigripulchritudo]CCN37555.1 putative Transcriptional regulator RpiR family [Vibrio nigripulchritudo AM115]CCN39582.1 putative Transcriptional regulator RpiR family [Vibrio nigripulchritudo FTn2]CCN66792.1 putative Transcriptional regulator RpiR family [Vibrio nigripulchritudo POn4]CCN75682.1 putative Transcriptional regulator RpiR family [Vibrio nigripulchritudo SO65]